MPSPVLGMQTWPLKNGQSSVGKSSLETGEEGTVWQRRESLTRFQRRRLLAVWRKLRITLGRSAVWFKDKAFTKVGRGDRAELTWGKSDPFPEHNAK